MISIATTMLKEVVKRPILAQPGVLLDTRQHPV
jgi:hypothetical protein